MRFVYLIVLHLFLSLSYYGQQTRIIEINEKYGLARPSYPNIICEPKYQSIEFLSPNCYLVFHKDYRGIVDSLGKEKIKPDTYTNHNKITDDLSGKTFFLLYNYRKYILIDETGTIVANNLYNIIAKSGDVLIVSVSKSDSLQNKLFFNEKDKEDKTGIIDIKGNWIIRPDNRVYKFLTNDCIYVGDHHKLSGLPTSNLYNRKGVPIVAEGITAINYGKVLSDSLAKLKISILFNDEFVWRVDSTGKVLSKKGLAFPGITIYRDAKNKYGCMQNDKVIIEPSYDELTKSVHYIFGRNTGSKTIDIFDMRGKLLGQTENAKFHYFIDENNRDSKEYLVAEKKDGLFILDEKFNPVSTTLTTIKALYYKRDTILFLFESKNLFGVINQSGKIIIPAKNKTEPIIANSIIKIRNTKNLYDIYDLNGNSLLKNISAIRNSSVNPKMYIITSKEGESVYSFAPLKLVVPPGSYKSFLEVPECSFVIGFQKEKKFILNKNYELWVNTPFTKTVKDKNNDSTILVTTEANKKQLLDMRMNKVGKEYDSFSSFSGKGLNEKIIVSNAKKYGLINYKGKELISCEWDTIINLSGAAAVKSGGKYFFTDTNFVVNKVLVADSIADTYNTPMYFINNKYRFVGHNKVEAEFDKIKDRQSENAIQVKKNGKWGVYSLTKNNWRVLPYFDSVVNVFQNHQTNEFVYTTQIGKHYYFIDSVKNIIRGPGFDLIEPIYKKVDVLNHYLPNFIVNKGGSFSNSKYQNEVFGGKFGISNGNGDLLHPMDGDNIIPLVYENYNHGWASVLGYLWNQGGVVTEYVSKGRDSIDIEAFDEAGNSILKREIEPAQYNKRITGGKFGIVGPNGKEILPVIYDKITFELFYSEKEQFRRHSYSDSSFNLHNSNVYIFPIYLKKDNKYGAADLSGKIIMPLEYDSIDDGWIPERAIQVWKNGGYGYFDLLGKPLIDVAFTHEQLFIIDNVTEDALYLFQKNGTVSTFTVVGPPIDQIEVDVEGTGIYTTVTPTVSVERLSGGKYGLVDQKTLKWLLLPEYEDIRFAHFFDDPDNINIPVKTSVTDKFLFNPRYSIDHTQAGFEIKKNGKWGVYQYNKGVIIEPLYEEIEILSSTSSIKIKQAGKWGILNTEGKAVLNAQFDEITLQENTIYKTLQAGVTKYFTLEGNATEAK
ncbi:MAG: WG repeat-containing protein [Bacteroidetes bacterium]|nr:WG repeat-containing protein [Bacteroidota bacterium]